MNLLNNILTNKKIWFPILSVLLVYFVFSIEITITCLLLIFLFVVNFLIVPKTAPNIKRIICYAIFSLLTVLVFMPLNNLSNTFLNNFMILFNVIYFTIIFRTLLIIESALSAAKCKDDSRKVSLIIALLPNVIVMIITFIAVKGHPLYNHDSLSTMDGIFNKSYSDWHTFAFTLFVKIFTVNLKFPPLYLITVFATHLFVVYYTVDTLKKKLVSNKIIYFISFFLALSPLFILQNLTMTKDTMFTFFFILSILFFYRLIYLKIKWMDAVVGVTSIAGTMMFRANGLYLIILMYVLLAILFILKKVKFNKRYTLILALPLIVFFLFSTVVENAIFKVNHNSASVKYTIPMQNIAAVVYYDGNISDEEKIMIEKILPLETLKNYYHKYFADPVTREWREETVQYEPVLVPPYTKGLHERIEENGMNILKLNISLGLKNPGIITRSMLDINSILLQPDTIDGSYTNTVFCGDMHSHFTWPATDLPYEGNRVLFNIVADYVEFFAFENAVFESVFFRGGLYCIIILYLFMMAFLKNSKKTLLCLSPVIFFIITLFISIPTQDSRYIQPLILLSICMLPIFIKDIFKPNSMRQIKETNIVETPDENTAGSHEENN